MCVEFPNQSYTRVLTCIYVRTYLYVYTRGLTYMYIRVDLLYLLHLYYISVYVVYTLTVAEKINAIKLEIVFSKNTFSYSFCRMKSFGKLMKLW
mgnify:CR=1 FL=1